MAKFVIIIFGLLSSTFGNPVRKSYEQTNDFYLSRERVVDFNVDIIESGKEYTEKIRVDEDKQTELFQVPAHPGVDRNDVLHDFKHNLSMFRFPESKICYLFPLVERQSKPKKLIRDLKKAKTMVITETRREDSTWILDGEVTDRSGLGEELEDFCTQYSIYRVKEMQESMKVAEIQTKEGRANRIRRQSASLNTSVSCPGSMNTYGICPEPKLKCTEVELGSFSFDCDGDGGCRSTRSSNIVTCCDYFCDNVGGSGSEGEAWNEEAAIDVPDGKPGDEGSGSGQAASQAVYSYIHTYIHTLLQLLTRVFSYKTT